MTLTFSDPAEALAARTRVEGDCLVWAGSTSGKGYGALRVGPEMVLAHRFAWEQVHGEIPADKVMDHICHNKRCVKVEHLRLATLQENGIHRAGANSLSTTGVRNVFPHRHKFQVQIRVDGSQQNFGTYASLEEASAVAESARQKLFGEFAGLR